MNAIIVMNFLMQDKNMVYMLVSPYYELYYSEEMFSRGQKYDS